ncbi:MAG: hypothetical protein ACRD9L_03895 [Bryobacteraceae bacterium]
MTKIALLLTISACCQASLVTHADGFGVYYFYLNGLPQLGNVRCDTSGSSSDAVCDMNGAAYNGYIGGYAEGTALPDTITAFAVAGSAEGGSSMEVHSFASFAEQYSFAPDPGQNPATQVQLFVSSLLFGDAYYGTTLDGTSIGPGNFYLTQPFNGVGFGYSGTVQVSVFAESPYGGDGEMYDVLRIAQITMLDASGAPVKGTLTLVPEPALGVLAGLLACACLLRGRGRASESDSYFKFDLPGIVRGIAHRAETGAV